MLAIYDRIPIPGLLFKEVDNFDARSGYRRCSPPGVGTSIARGQSAVADFWRNSTDNVFVRFTSREYVYCYECYLVSGDKIEDSLSEGEFAYFIMELLLLWLCQGIDDGPLTNVTQEIDGDAEE